MVTSTKKTKNTDVKRFLTIDVISSHYCWIHPVHAHSIEGVSGYNTEKLTSDHNEVRIWSRA